MTQWAGFTQVHTNTDTLPGYTFEPDTVHHTIAMSLNDTSERGVSPALPERWRATVTERPPGSHSIDVAMKYYSPDSFRLMSRGFHRISE